MYKNIYFAGKCIALLFSLVYIDYFLGNGFLHMVQKSFCKICCYIKKNKFEFVEKSEEPRIPANISIFIIELVILGLAQAILKKLIPSRGEDHLDELIRENKEALRLCGELLEKWRMRSTCTAARKLQERGDAGDAGDAATYTESTVSLTSLFEEEEILRTEELDGHECHDRYTEVQNQFLGHVQENDPN